MYERRAPPFVGPERVDFPLRDPEAFLEPGRREGPEDGRRDEDPSRC